LRIVFERFNFSLHNFHWSLGSKFAKWIIPLKINGSPIGVSGQFRSARVNNEKRFQQTAFYGPESGPAIATGTTVMASFAVASSLLAAPEPDAGGWLE